MADHLIVIGGSAGALEPLRTVIAALPADLPATVLVTMHLSPSSKSALPEILSGSGVLPARHPRHGERLSPGTIFVAPPDLHLVVHDDVVHLSRGPQENRHRPSVDALFNSAARWHGPRVAGVVLSGALDDGAAGATAIAAQDGLVLVQSLDEATVHGMPQAASKAVRSAVVAPAAEIGTLLVKHLDGETGEAETPASGFVEWESDNVDTETTQTDRGLPPAKPAALGCPDCSGGMFEARTASGDAHYVCHVGHSWSPESLMQAQRRASEAAMYAAAAKLLEEALVLRRIASPEGDGSPPEEATELERRAAEAERKSQAIQDLVQS